MKKLRAAWFLMCIIGAAGVGVISYSIGITECSECPTCPDYMDSYREGYHQGYQDCYKDYVEPWPDEWLGVIG